MSDSALETRPVTIAGRQILVCKPTAAQTTMIYRSGKVGAAAAQAAENIIGDGDEVPEEARPFMDKGFMAVGAMLDVIEWLVVNPEDREFLQQQMIQGKIDLPDIEPIVQAWANRQERRAAAKRA